MNPSSSQYRFWIYLLASLGALVAALFAYLFVFRYPIWTLRAFRSPSRSMCPTICEDERVFVQMLYGTPYVPNRGDVVAFLYGQDRSVFVKRVIGLPGDIVASGPNGGILVNGRAWQPPPICGKPVVEAAQNNSALYSAFTQTHVAPGHLFVIGDNLQDSFDSRIPDFAPVTPDTVIGKPVMIYWSKGNSRIGCAVR